MLAAPAKCADGDRSAPRIARTARLSNNGRCRRATTRCASAKRMATEHVITIRVTAGRAGAKLAGRAEPHPGNARDCAAAYRGGAGRGGRRSTMQTANTNPFTRVHVAATRFMPTQGMFAGLAGFHALRTDARARRRNSPNLFSSGRAIGDEYRYIIERRYTRRFPGNMLTRPGLLLNPWEKRVDGRTRSSRRAWPGGRLHARRAVGRAPAPSGADGCGDHAASRRERKTQTSTSSPTPAPVLCNLTPDKDGLIVVPRAAARRPAARADLRRGSDRTPSGPRQLAGGADEVHRPAAHAESRSGESLHRSANRRRCSTARADPEDRRSAPASWRPTTRSAAFTRSSPRSAHDAKLAQFAWVLQWPKLKDEEKRAKYSETPATS